MRLILNSIWVIVGGRWLAPGNQWASMCSFVAVTTIAFGLAGALIGHGRATA